MAFFGSNMSSEVRICPRFSGTCNTADIAESQMIKAGDDDVNGDEHKSEMIMT